MEPMLGGVSRIMAYISGPGQITHAGIEPAVVLGELDGTRSARAEAIYEAFQGCQGVTSTLSDDIRRDIWTKFLFIAPVSAVGAVTRSPADRFLAVPETRRLLETAMREVETLARARGVTLADDVVAKNLAFVDHLPAGATASMQRDIMEGRPSELDAQSGAIVRMGRESGVPTPANEYPLRRPQAAGDPGAARLARLISDARFAEG